LTPFVHRTILPCVQRIARAAGVLAALLLAAGLSACSDSSGPPTEAAAPTTGGDTVATTSGCGPPTLYPSKEAGQHTVCVAETKCSYGEGVFGCPDPDAAKAPKDCLAEPSEDALSGAPCIRGTWKLVQKTTEKPNDHQTITTDEPLTVEFSLWALDQDKLVGAAHLTHSVDNTEHDTQSTGCKAQRAIVDEVSWDVPLEGMYLLQPDGNVQVIARASPSEGPELVQHFDGCPIPDRKLPGVTWPAVSAVLVKGAANVRQDLPKPSGAAGESSLTISLVGPGG
jgi:hypothetical protein